MDRTKKVFISFTFILCCLAVSLLAAALGTEYWVVSSPKRNESIGAFENGTLLQASGKVNFGLFLGSKVLNYGLGEEGRKYDLWTSCKIVNNTCFLAEFDTSMNQGSMPDEGYKDEALFNFALWVATVLFIVLAMIFGLFGVLFAVINIVTRPIEVITGFVGLFVWNGLAATFSCLAIIMYVILFYDKLNASVLSKKEESNRWYSTNLTYFGYSFWIVIASTLIYCLNILILIMSNIHLKPLPYKADMNEKGADGMMMY